MWRVATNAAVAVTMALCCVLFLFAETAEASCFTFYSGLCPGDQNCMCTLGEACGTRSNLSVVQGPDGGCSGQCREVQHGACAGPDDCIEDVGSCGGSSSSGSSNPPPPPSPPSPPGPGPTPSRGQIMECAQTWVNDSIPYCQCSGGPASECCGYCPYCGQFRCDCSGYVSYCMGLPYAYTTDTLPEATYQIDQSELQQGDIMLCEGTHVVFFGGWTDATQQYYVAYQEPGCHTAGPHYAYSSVVPYPFDWNPSCFVPYRLNGLAHKAAESLAPIDAIVSGLSAPRSFPDQHNVEATVAAAKVAAHAVEWMKAHPGAERYRRRQGE